MKIALCVDDRYGMLFNRRRQSKDGVLRSRLLELAKDKILWMNPYSGSQFCQPAENICMDEDFLQKAGDGDICFVENVHPGAWLSKCDTIILYSWNRVYPANVYFPEEQLKGWQLKQVYDFAGSSHEKITERIYEKK